MLTPIVPPAYQRKADTGIRTTSRCRISDAALLQKTTVTRTRMMTSKKWKRSIKDEQ